MQDCTRRAGGLLWACFFDDRAGARRAIIPAMLREPRRHELFHAPPEFLCAGERVPSITLPLGGRVRPATLRRFVRAMAAQGVAVQAARLGYDRLYAFECFARAHACDDALLRKLAVELFAAFERNGA